MNVNGRLFFAATNGTTGPELWMIPRADYDFDGETGFPGPIPFGAPGLGDIALNRPAALR